MLTSHVCTTTNMNVIYTPENMYGIVLHLSTLFTPIYCMYVCTYHLYIHVPILHIWNVYVIRHFFLSLQISGEQLIIKISCRLYMHILLHNTVKPEIKVAIHFSLTTNMSLLASINFGINLVLSPSHAYNTFLLASIYFGKIISCTKFTKINGKPIFQALQYVCAITALYVDLLSIMIILYVQSSCNTMLYLYFLAFLYVYTGLRNRAATVCLRCDRLRNSGRFTCGRCGDMYWTKPVVGGASETTDTPTSISKKKKAGLEPNWSNVPSEPGGIETLSLKVFMKNSRLLLTILFYIIHYFSGILSLKAGHPGSCLSFLS